MTTLAEFVSLRDQILRKGDDPSHSKEMWSMRDELEKTLLVRDNINLLTSRSGHVAQGEMSPGWFSLVGDCLDAVAKTLTDEKFKNYKVTFVQIKEKFGGLRMYFDLYSLQEDEDVPDFVYEAVREHVTHAEESARNTCEVCGQPGSLSNCGGWIQTLCSTHAHLKAAK